MYMRPCCSVDLVKACEDLMRTLLKPGEDFVDDLVEDLMKTLLNAILWKKFLLMQVGHLEAKFLNNANWQPIRLLKFKWCPPMDPFCLWTCLYKNQGVGG